MELKHYRRKREILADAAAWYLNTFPIERGKGGVNRLLGTFLRITLFEGIRIRLLNPLEFHQKILLLGKEVYEPEVTVALGSLLKPGMVFFDIGANLGYYTLLASKAVGGGGEVHAFEPAPAQFRHLTLNARINRAINVKLNNLALAESSGVREMFLSDGWNHGTHSFAKVGGVSKSYTVQCTTVDEYIARTGVARIDVMKIDAEGSELLILKGARKTLLDLRPRVIVFEACEEHARAQRYSTSEVKEYLIANGYRVIKLDSASSPTEADAASPETYANLAAIHTSAESWYYEALSARLAGRAMRKYATK